MERLPGLGCRAERQWGEVGLIRRAAVKARMWAAAIVKVEITADRNACFADAFVAPQIDVLVLELRHSRSMNTLSLQAPAVHPDFDAGAGKHGGEGSPGELRALVGVEDLRPAETRQRVLQCLDAEARVHGDRQPPRQNPAGRPVDHRREIEEAARHREWSKKRCALLLPEPYVHLSAHTALCSSLAHGHSNIMIVAR